MKKKLKFSLLIAIILYIAINMVCKNTNNISLATNSNVADEKTFTLYNQDGETFEPVKGTKFIITDLNGNNVTGTDGEKVGNLENIDGKDYYVLTTDENGYIYANLPKGSYKAVKIYVEDKYMLEENEADRTYYFEIKSEEIKISQCINGITGHSWNSIKATIGTNNGGVATVGSISSYSPKITGNYYDGIDLNSDGKVDEVSKGNNDGLINLYDKVGTYLWSKTIGGDDDDCCNDIVQVSDGGYIIVGYVSSKVVYLGNEIITDLSSSNHDTLGKDGFILKIDSKGKYEWGIRIGGKLDDEIFKIIQNSKGDINIIGDIDSKKCNFYESNSNSIVKSSNNIGEKSSFIASYSSKGKYKWSKMISGGNYIQIKDITEVNDSIVVIADYKGTINLDENNQITNYLLDYQSGIIISYSLDGNFEWYYDIYSSSNGSSFLANFIKTTAITTTKDNQLVVAIGCKNVIKGRKFGSNDYTTIYKASDNGISANIFILSDKGEFIKNLYNIKCKESVSSVHSATILFNDMVCTNDNNILIGGYYYAAGKVDVDKDGSTTGEYDFISSESTYSNGCVIKLDLEGKVTFADCMYRYERETYSPSSVTCVNETNENKIILGGNFYWNTVTTKNFYGRYSKEDDYQNYYLNKIGNVDGFLILEDLREEKTIFYPASITVDNLKKIEKITNIYQLPVTGSKEIIIIDLFGAILICLGIYLINYATYIKATVRPELIEINKEESNREKERNE